MPPDFDSGADSQVHVVARHFFLGPSYPAVLGQAQQWWKIHEARVLSATCDHRVDEAEPIIIALSFSFVKD